MPPIRNLIQHTTGRIDCAALTKLQAHQLLLVKLLRKGCTPLRSHSFIIHLHVSVSFVFAFAKAKQDKQLSETYIVCLVQSTVRWLIRKTLQECETSCVCLLFLKASSCAIPQHSLGHCPFPEALQIRHVSGGLYCSGFLLVPFHTISIW